MNNFFKKKTRFHNVLRDESAVSPMIATIMLIAVVAVLGAVIAASSMAGAGNVDTANIAATLKAAQVSPTDYNITLAHAGGDKLPINKITYSVTLGENSAPKFEKLFFGNAPADTNYTLTIQSPNSDPGTLKAGETITIGAVTDGTIDTTAGIPKSGNVTGAGKTYHVVVRYDNKKVLYDSNIETS